MDNLENIMSYIYDLSITYGLKLLLALVTLIIGLWIIKLIIKGIGRSMEKKDVDPTLRQFLNSLLSMLLKVMLIISVISMLGVEMTSFVAILAAAGLAVGMALSGTLQNFAGGVMIVLFKPFKIGDFIDAQGYTGMVKEIQIFNTILKTPDNKTIIIPNGGLSTSAMTNYSTEEQRRVDFTFGIGYGDDIDKAKKVIEGLIEKDSRVFADPAPFIAVSELADSSVNFVVRVWANAADYWGIYFDLTENVKKAFDKEGISIPFPQTDVHIYNEKQ
ncbi:MAG: mechanosensitive ion channel [Bacteroidales bacterium]